MRRLRTASPRRLAAAVAAVAVLAAGGGIAQAALGGSGAKPPAKPLDHAVYDALHAPAPAGVSARVTFTNGLLPAGSLPGSKSSPLTSGATGRLWVTGDGRLRVELQSNAGDAQIVAGPDGAAIYDPASKTVYRLPAPPAGPDKDPADAPSLAAVQRGLARLAGTWTLSGARPSSVAGRPAYTVHVAPKDDGGLLGAAEVAWDAANGTPLRAAVYAAGGTEPVLELRADHISFGAVPDDDVTLHLPDGTRTVTVDPAVKDRHGHVRHVQGLDAVRRHVDFPVAAPAKLAGLPRTSVHLVDTGDSPAVLSTYGKGLGAIAVLERDGAELPGELQRSSLPRINIGGTTGTELATPLGTAVTFARGDVGYVVVGSVPPVAAENAARGLR